MHIESDTKFKINQVASNSYKTIESIFPNVFQIVLDANNFGNMLKYTKFAIAAHESRANLNCIAMKYENNQIIAYGMDGHRFARFAMMHDQLSCHKSLNASVDLDENNKNSINTKENFSDNDQYFINYIQSNDPISQDLIEDSLELNKSELDNLNNNILTNNHIIKIKEIDFKILLPTKLIDQILTIISTFKIENIYMSINQHDIILIFSNANINLTLDATLDANLNKPNNNLDVNINNFNIYKNNYINLTSKLVNAEFIDYDKIIPNFQNYEYIYQINASTLSESVSKVTAISNEKFKALKCEFFTNTIQITSYGQNDAKAVDIISIIKYCKTNNQSNDQSVKNNNDKGNNNVYTNLSDSDINQVVVGFNYRYLLDVLDVLKDHNIKIYIQNNMSPIVIISEKLKNSIFIIMPIKI